MAYISPISASIPVFKSSKKETKNKSDSSNKSGNKSNWKKKLLIGSIITGTAVALVCGMNPARRIKQKNLEQVFDTVNGAEERLFPFLSKREEVIITEAAKGNSAAKNLMSSIPQENHIIKKYLETQEKIREAQSRLESGRFERLKRRNDKTPEDTKVWYNKMITSMKKYADNIYQKHIRPRF